MHIWLGIEWLGRELQYTLINCLGLISSSLVWQVFISIELYSRVCKIFECVKVGKRKGIIAKQGSKIDHELLSLGNLQEVRHVFARILFDTVYPITLSQDT